MTEVPNTLVSTEWLAAHLNAPDIRIVDASWYLPGSGRDPRAEYKEGHIPGAVFFDIDEICDTANPLPHMLPSQEKFASRVRKLGLGDGVKIIVYDGAGLFSAARVWPSKRNTSGSRWWPPMRGVRATRSPTEGPGSSDRLSFFT